MNDTMKGISILLLTAVAISWVLNQDNEGFDMAFLTNDSAERSAALQIQQSILAGADPTQNQEPTAAGVSDLNCYRGRVSVYDEQMTLEKQAYISVANQTSMFLRVAGQKIILEIPINDKTIARRVMSVPVDIAVELADMQKLEERCARKDLIISVLK